MYTSIGKALWRAKRSLWGEIKRKDEQADREALARIVPDTLLARQLKQYDDGPECALRFAGQWEDEESGLHYNLHRYYDPKTGQYLSSDPIGLNGGLRTHTYVHDPVQWIDPWGFAGCGETGGEARKPFALRLREHLDSFAEARGAETWKNLPDPAQWKSGVLDALADPERQVHFNLDGVDNVWSSVQRAAAGRGGATDWELLQIQQNPDYWDSVQFWKNEQQVPNPFE